MAPAAVRFHPAAVQEAESTYDWYAARDPAAADGFREELRQAIDAVAANPRTWPRASATELGGTCSLDTPSAWCTSSAAVTSRLLPWPMVGVGLATGGHDSDAPSNFRMQRSALRAAADR
jgi:plasmid stabilization system protein ParE